MSRMKEDPNGYVLVKLDVVIESAQKSCDKFAEKFLENPLYQLKWADDTFRKAAELDVFTQYRNNLIECAKEGGWLQSNTLVNMLRWLKETKSYAEGEALRAARYPAGSSSRSSNLAETEVAHAQFEVYELCQSLIYYIEYELFEENISEQLSWVAANIPDVGLGYNLKMNGHTYVVRRAKPKSKSWVIVHIAAYKPVPEADRKYDTEQQAMEVAQRMMIATLYDEQKKVVA
jgi:hypothetical protein